MNYFDEQAALLQRERDYDREQHETLLMQRSIDERRGKGVTWFPITIGNSELGRGDYLTVTLHRTNRLEEGHQFRFGMPVSLFSNHAAADDRIDGIIAFVNRDTMRVAFRTDELPDWSRRGKLGVDLLFDENAYKEMQDALDRASALRNDKQQGHLVRQLIGEEAGMACTDTGHYEHEALNPSQVGAVSRMLGTDPLIILHGPPGTGKTTTLIHGVKALLENGSGQLLLVAPSNTAVDVLTERLDAAGISVVRIGNPVRVSDHLLDLTLDAQTEKHSAAKEMKHLQKQANAYSEMAQKYKRHFGKAEREQRKALRDEARKLRKEIDLIQDYMIADILNRVEVITATLVGANQYPIRDRRYETVIIDEAAQALEPACWIPILKANRIILAGDHCQLPPTVKSAQRADEGLYLTLFEKLLRRYPACVSLLTTQYRMHTEIMQYPSRALYDSQLQAAPAVANWTLPGDAEPIVFIDTAGAGFEESEEQGAIDNIEEAYFLRDHLRNFIQSWEANAPHLDRDFPTIGVVAPYRRQATRLKELFEQDEEIHRYTDFIRISTIDSFQGQERELIYISLTRSNAEQRIGFLADVRRMNVAMTRAQKKLIVIGDSGTIAQHDFYKGFLAYVESIGRYHSIWEWHTG